MNKQNNNMQVPIFLQKATEAAKTKTNWEESVMEAIDEETYAAEENC